MRRHAAGLLAALMGFGLAGFGAAEAPPAAGNPRLDVYGAPQQLVKLPDGRRINLYCQGHGSPTVVLTAGQGGWAISWAKVHAAIARRTRTCAWDRAAFGHSDPSALPQTVANTTADLEAALAAAKIKGPYVLVGHSAGAFETLMFADRHRADVVGMVLVDGSVPDQAARFASVAPDAAKTAVTGTAGSVSWMRACADRVAAKTLTPDQKDWASCFQYPPGFAPKAVEALKALDADPARLRTKASLVELFAANAATVANPSRSYGDLPLVVLTQSGGPGLPGSTPEQTAALNAGWTAWHDEYAKLSTRGVNLVVRGAGHSIQSDKPQAVIGAVDGVLDAVQFPVK